MKKTKVKLIDGKRLADEIKLKVRNEVVTNSIEAGLAIILVGDDPASQLYVKLKEKACNEVEISFHKYLLDKESDQKKLNDLIDFLNNDESITGVLLQLPLPSHLDADLAVARIKKEKDVDGFGPENLKDFMQMKAKIIPGLPNGIYELIKSTGENLKSKKTLIIANSEIFAAPIVNMMRSKNAEAEFIAKTDPELVNKSKNSDIVIIAVGQKWFLDKEMVKEGAIIIDVGTNRDGKETYGDVNPNVDEVVAFRTPVPGGVGPMTIAMLLFNTIELYKIYRRT